MYKSFFKYFIHNCLLGAVKLARNTNARNAWSHNYGTLPRNVIICRVVISASHFTENENNNFFLIESGPAQFAEDTKNFLSYLTKANCEINSTQLSEKICMNLHYNSVTSYLNLNGKRIHSLKQKVYY